MRLGSSAVGVCLCFAALADGQEKPPQRPAPAAAPPSGVQRAIEEFKIQTRNYGLRPDSPRKSASRSAQRAWHGRLYENFRNDFLDALPHQIRQRGGTKSLLRRNQFGFNVGGPVWLPKLWEPRATFFSVSYEGVREGISRTSLRTVPTLEERTGDWAHVVDQAGNLLPIYDPRTTRPNPEYNAAQPVSAENLQYLRDPFPNNRIPTDRLDPVARRALEYYPAPNASAGPFYRNNYFINSPETNHANGMIAKVDHSLRQRHRLNFELAFSNGLAGAADWFPSIADPGPTDRDFHTRRGNLEHVFTISPNTVNTLTFEASSERSNNTGSGVDADAASLIGLRGVGPDSFPLFNLGPYVPMGRSYPISTNARNTYSWTEAVSWRYGKHNLRASGQWLYYQVNTYWPQYPSGSFRFGEGLTSLPGVVNTGHAFASFLLGYAEYAERSMVTSPSYFRRSTARVLLRDRYELQKNFTVSLGLNLERAAPRVEKYDRQSTVDLEAVNPENGRPGALIAAGKTSRGRGFRRAHLWAEPSVSVAWNPRGNPKSVVRAYFSRSYSAIPIYTGQWGTQGFSAYPTFISPNVQLQPAATLVAGLGGSVEPLPDLRPEAANHTVADLMDLTSRIPTYQSAGLTLERELPSSTVVSVGWAYSGGKNLLVSNGAAQPNAIHPDYLAYRDLLNDEEFNRSLRPYPQYKGFDVYSSYPGGRYQRDVGFVRVEKRASSGLSMTASYEFSKQMDDYSGPYGKQDYYNRENEWSLTPGNEPHRLYFTYTYELPIGSNKPVLDYEDWRRHLLDGWSVSGTGSVQSGNPIYLRPAFNNTGGVIQALRVNLVPGVDPQVAEPSPDLWFNPDAFAQPPDFTLGDGPRTHPSLRNPGSQNFDLSLNKRFALRADKTLEFSAAGFNFLNHANWDNPDNTIGTASAPNVNAGKILESRGGRVVQLGLRLSF
jgi:hypothetical protein